MPHDSSDTTHENAEISRRSLKRKHSTLDHKDGVHGSDLGGGTDAAKEEEMVRDSGLYAILAQFLNNRLHFLTEDDCIHLCGSAIISSISTYPDQILELAHEKLHAWPYHEVPKCWRRLYEEASLWKVAKILGESSEVIADSFNVSGNTYDDSLSRIVAALDMGMSLSAQPSRREEFQLLLDTLDHHTGLPITGKLFPIETPTALASAKLVATTNDIPFNVFQHHLDKDNTPLIMTGVLSSWPAMQLWTNPDYLLHRTLGGRRLVPIEIGQSYTHEDWTQRIMPFGRYLKEFIVSESPEGIGYLAQHDMLSQLPALKNDIRIPDYCHTCPPAAPSALTKQPDELDEPQLNAWFGPKGTRSPLHTDPYANVLCQVVGFKYVRLYAPDQTSKLYPRSTDENGVDMSNTSNIDFSFKDRGKLDVDQHPMLVDAQYLETILAPGECLYIPAGWWHFIESLSISFSVSFWWN